jgi:hypothetical protein
LSRLYESRLPELATIVDQESRSFSKEDRYYHAKIADIIATQADIGSPDVTLEERIIADGNDPHEFDLERFSHYFDQFGSPAAPPAIFESMSLIRNREKTLLSDAAIADTIDSLGPEAMEVHSAEINRRNLATLEISSRKLRELPEEERERILTQLSILRTSWYLYYGFIDTRLLATYMAYGTEQEMSIEDIVTKWIDPIDHEGDETYYVTIAGKTSKKKGTEQFSPERILGHIGIVHAVENAQDRMDEIFDPETDVLHIDQVHIDPEKIVSGMRTIEALDNDPTRIRNVLEVTRFAKSPFLRNRRQLAVMWLLTERAMRKFKKISNNGKEGLVVVMDVEDDAAGKTFSFTGLGGTRGSSNGTTSATVGLLYPRWVKDRHNIGRGGPTLPIAFTEQDLAGVEVNGVIKTEPERYMADILRIANTSSPIARFIRGMGALDTCFRHLIHTTDSHHISLRGQNGARTSLQVGPEELSRGTEEEAYQRLVELYGEENANYLPLPEGEMFDAADVSTEAVERVTYPERVRKSKHPEVSWRTILHPDGQLTPLGNRYHRRTGSHYDLDTEIEVPRMTEESILGTTIARGGYLPILRNIIEQSQSRTGGLRAAVPRWLARYILPPSLSLSEIKRLTGTHGKIENQRSLGKNTVFICTGFGTGGTHPFIAVESGLPAAKFILIDHGAIEPKNTGHQYPTLKEVGASKIAIAIDRAMSNGPVAAWDDTESDLGSLYGINRPYTKELDEVLEGLVTRAGEDKNIVLIDEIDVTDSKSIRAKIEFHQLAIKLSNLTGKPVSVVGGLDLGQGALWRGHWVYDRDSEPFYGVMNIREGMEPFVEHVSPMVLLAPLFLQDSTLPPEMQLLLLQLASDGTLDGISQTSFSATQSGTHVGLSAVLAAITQNAGWTAEQMREAIDPVYVTNPIVQMLQGKNSAIRKAYLNAGGNEGQQLLSYILSLSALIYDTDAWPRKMKTRIQSRIASLFKRAQTARDSF